MAEFWLDATENSCWDLETQGRYFVWQIEWKNSQINNDDLCLLFWLLSPLLQTGEFTLDIRM